MPGLPRPITVTPIQRRRRRETAAAWAYISPAVLIILGLGVVPVAWSLVLSFQADDLVTPSRWVGVDNYAALAQDPHFAQAVGNTVLYTVLYVPLSILIGFLPAQALNVPGPAPHELGRGDGGQRHHRAARAAGLPRRAEDVHPVGHLQRAQGLSRTHRIGFR